MEKLNKFNNEFQSCSNVIEEAYEFMLAYAAQGRTKENSDTTPNIRSLMTAASSAATQIGSGLGMLEAELDQILDESASGFFEITRADAIKAKKLLNLALSCENITSQLIDNLNASIHLRTLLKDLFVFDEYLTAQLLSSSGNPSTKSNC
jgi:hypothetical protein